MVLEGLPEKAVFEQSGSGGVSPGESWGKSILGSRNSTAKAGVGVGGGEEGVEWGGRGACLHFQKAGMARARVRTGVTGVQRPVT